MQLKERVLTHLRDLYEDDPEMAEESTEEIQSMLDCAHDPCTVGQVLEILKELESEGKVLSDYEEKNWLATGARLSWTD